MGIKSFIFTTKNGKPFTQEAIDRVLKNVTETKTAKYIIEQARKINPNSEYIFIKDGKPIVTSTVNRRLKKCCDQLGIDYRSSHKVRFSTASILNKNGVEAIEIQKMLGYTTLTMTNHYLGNVTPVLETSKRMAEIFG